MPALDYLTLVRDRSEGGATRGQLLINGEFRWWALEDEVRAPGVKIAGETAIPPGRYRVLVNRSNRFSFHASAKAGHPVDVFLPLLLNVPMFEGIRIHGGVSPRNTEGCILVGGGYDTKARVLNHCKEAVDAIVEGIRQEGNEGRQVWMTILNAPDVTDPGVTLA